MRVGDLQQIMLQTDTVGKVQQQGSHGAEVEQSKLASQQLAKDKKRESQVQSMEESDTVIIKDRESRQKQQEEAENDESGTGGAQSGEQEPEAQDLSTSGRVVKHIDIRASLSRVSIVLRSFSFLAVFTWLLPVSCSECSRAISVLVRRSIKKLSISSRHTSMWCRRKAYLSCSR